jgi:hypothetical protein
VASANSLSSTVRFLKKLPDPDGLIIPGTKMTNTGPFLRNGSSKIQISLTFEPSLLNAAEVEVVTFSIFFFFDETQMVDNWKHANHDECFLM